MAKHRVDRRTDLELIGVCNDGDAAAATEAFGVLYERHRDYVLRVAMRFTGNRETTLDVLQETFAYLLRRFPPTGTGFELTAKLTTFLYPVAKNFAISAHRQSARLETTDGADPDDLAAADDPVPDDIDAALAGLSAAHREVLLLRFVDDLSLAEIAAALSVPVGTVKSRIHLAVKQLREDPRIKDLFPE